MIINIPLSINDSAIESSLERDLDKKVDEYVKRYVEKKLSETDVMSYFAREVDIVIENMGRRTGDHIIERHEDEIIEKAVSRISQRISNRKKLNEAITITVHGLEVE